MIYKPYKILMVTMSMGYGGAETHILELSKHLKQIGIDVKVVSNGGEYVQNLKAENIEHIKAPFHTRNMYDMHKAGKILKQEIKKFKPDVVHAHARIPAFVASRICRQMKVPLVTTAHGTYVTSPLLNLATNWGDYTLYASDDIKDYLMKNYGLKAGNMSKTINAINTDLFSQKDINGTAQSVRNEFKINQEEKIILTVSRLDKYSSFSAYKLIEISQALYRADKNTRIVIVGAGEVFEDIKNKAGAINKILGFEYIIITGGKTDVYRFCMACDVFVGISRAALEAMSCGKSIILCGDMGYLGRFCDENRDGAEKTNFTCRGFGYPADTNGTLLKDIIYCLDADGRNKKDLDGARQSGTSLIAEKYSVSRMANDAYSAYEKAVLKYKKFDFILTGYYGHDNIGDSALMNTIIHNICAGSGGREYKICILAKNPKKLQNNLNDYFSNITAKSRFNIFHVRKAIKDSKALVFGGGTLLQDNTSTRSLAYYVFLLKTAQKYGKKTILYANGIGPVYLEKNKRKVENIAKNLTLATIRDEMSYNMLLDMGIDSERIYLTADEAITIKQNKYLDVYKRNFKEYINGNYLVISVRKWKDAGTAFFAEFAAAIDVICREMQLIPVYVAMESKNDRSLSEHMATLNSRGYAVRSDGDIEKILTVIKSASAVISMRLHTVVFAAAFGVPMIGISYDPKVRAFMSDIFGNDDYTLDIRNFSKDILIDKFRSLTVNRDDIKALVESSAAKLCERADDNARLFINEINL